ncbi:MAG: response regulator transcription factor [Flavobacteriales bacterium]|jgi:DNA-binding response OmpR family regulator|uniref:response regulator transcription factor n=1 Tax=Candidatus Ulvibacter alkanivorans TaxID=2267620 RepID=UPI000DF3B00A|nr:response regulator transcription factor [Candidatus Ulvibacter alkanivorans]MCH2489074.1 response regulator transcription factor [Flavobacteriales bacterium]
MKKILLAEDDIDFGTMLKRYLELNKYEVTWAKDGKDALKAFTTDEFDICILDVMMPVMDGFTLAKKIIELNPEIPFLFLTARKTKEDRIKGLRLGADDYIAKPFEAEELILRIQNIVKRTQQQSVESEDVPEGKILAIGAYKFDFHNLELSLNDNTQKITEKEARLLLYLFRNKNQLIRREDILSHVWNKNDFFSGRSMDVFITRIRKHLKDDSAIAIKSVRGIGLEFNINE